MRSVAAIQAESGNGLATKGGHYCQYLCLLSTEKPHGIHVGLV